MNEHRPQRLERESLAFMRIVSERLALERLASERVALDISACGRSADVRSASEICFRKISTPKICIWRG